jgi:hypothetical protein
MFWRLSGVLSVMFLRHRDEAEAMHPSERKWHHKLVISSHVRWAEKMQLETGQPWSHVDTHLVRHPAIKAIPQKYMRKS